MGLFKKKVKTEVNTETQVNNQIDSEIQEVSIADTQTTLESSVDDTTEQPKKKFKSSKKEAKQKGDKVQKEEEVKTPRNLYLLVEKNTPGIWGYFRGHGAPLKALRSSIEDMTIDMLVETGPCRLVIVEAGQGRFTSTGMRAEFIDLAGMCDGVDKKLTVFYTNSILKSDSGKKALGKQGGKIDWKPFTTTLNILEYLKSLGETYIDNGEDNEPVKKLEEALRFKGEAVQPKVPEIETQPFNAAYGIAELMKDESLPMFKVAY